MFVYVNNKGEFLISKNKLDTRKVGWGDYKFVRKMNITNVVFCDGSSLNLV